jgi:hypothetical protein
MELRPLGFGEIFDRAVTLYIRNFVPFAAIVVVLILPQAIVEYFIDLRSQPQFDALVTILTHPGRAHPATLPTAFTSASTGVLYAVLAVMTYVLWPLALNAVAVGVARRYRDLPVEFRACYEAVLRRWPQIIGLIALGLLIILVWYGAIFVAFMLFAVLLALLVAPLGPGLGILVITLVVTLAVLILLISGAPLLVALTFAMYGTVIEEQPMIEALVLAFNRIFNRLEFRRALLFSIAAGAITFAGSLMFGFVSLFAAYAHLPLLETMIDALSRAVVTPFAAVLLAVYYFDVRIRVEALDLEASLERLTAPQPG